jgi:hypothetical protein
MLAAPSQYNGAVASNQPKAQLSNFKFNFLLALQGGLHQSIYMSSRSAAAAGAAAVVSALLLGLTLSAARKRQRQQAPKQKQAERKKPPRSQAADTKKQSKSCTLFITGLPQAADARGIGTKLRRELNKAFGKDRVYKVIVASNWYRHLKGYATAVVSDEATAERAVAESGKLCVTLEKQQCLLTIAHAHKDKRDHLFPLLAAETRSALLLDTVAVYSTTDG